MYVWRHSAAHMPRPRQDGALSSLSREREWGWIQGLREGGPRAGLDRGGMISGRWRSPSSPSRIRERSRIITCASGRMILRYPCNKFARLAGRFLMHRPLSTPPPPSCPIHHRYARIGIHRFIARHFFRRRSSIEVTAKCAGLFQ